MPDDSFIEGEETTTPGNPIHNRGRLYWKNGCWTQLNEAGAEASLCNDTSLALDFISETILSASAASVTFSNIPQTFRHLQIIVTARTDVAAESDVVALRFNGDSGNNYDRISLTATGGSVVGAVARAGSLITIGSTEGANSRAAVFAPTFGLIFGYAISGQEKTCLGLSVNFGNLSADTDVVLALRGGLWRKDNVITSITILPATGPNFVSGSRFQLYGIL